MSGNDQKSLDGAIKLLVAQHPLTQNQQPNNVNDVLSALGLVLETSRVPERRSELDHPELFSSILSILEASTPSTGAHIRSDGLVPLRTLTLRCLGNLLADNNTNRNVFIEHEPAFQAIQHCMIYESAGEGDAVYEQAATALKVAFNLCHDYVPAQIASLKAGVDRAILQHVHTSLFVKKDDTIELALELLGDLTSHLKDVPSELEFGKDFVAQLLRLPCNEDVDPDTFIDMAAALGPYLVDSRFQEAILSANHIILAFDLLERTIFLLSNSTKAEEGKTFSYLLLRSLSDISALPSFPDSFPHNPNLIFTLTTRCILTENDTTSILPATTACILLGNYATPTTAPAISNQTNLPALYSTLSLQSYGRSRLPLPSADLADYLHSASGLLRQLARHPAAVLDKAATRTAAVALLHYPHAEVQTSALRLWRQLVHADPQYALSEAVAAGHATALGQLFASPAATDRLRLELARAAVAALRATAGQTLDPAVLSAFLADARVLDALSLAAGVEEMPLANAEGYLGFVLVSGLGAEGRRAVCERAKSDGALRGALRGAIVGAKRGGEDTDTVVRKGEGEDLPIEGPAGAAMLEERRRDNAVVLLSELLKAEELDGDVRDELDGIANEAGITLRL